MGFRRMHQQLWAMYSVEEQTRRIFYAGGPHPKTKTLTVNLPGEQVEWLKAESQRRNIPLSWLLTELVSLGLGEYDNPEATNSTEEDIGYRARNKRTEDESQESDDESQES